MSIVGTLMSLFVLTETSTASLIFIYGEEVPE
jgi:hypothetical protein